MPDTESSLLTPNALSYTWRQLARLAGVMGNSPQDNNGFDKLDVPICYANPDQIQLDQPGIIVVPCHNNAWQVLLERKPHSLNWLPVDEVVPEDAQLPFADSIPVLFWGAGHEDGHKPFVEQRADGTVIFHADIIATIFFMLSRWEETVVAVQDEHGRFPATASVAYKQGFLDRPIVDEYALILQKWLTLLLPRWTPTSPRFSVKLSHDIDVIKRFPNLRRAAQALGRDLLKYRSLKQGGQTLTDAVIQTVFPRQAIGFQGIHFLAGLSRTHNLDSAFYFMAAEPAPFDNGYDPASSFVKQCIEDLRQQGFEIGFHPGYHTLNDPERLALEKTRMDTVLGEESYGGRQHYLRFQVPNTWRHWAQVGLIYDSTMGYADHEGFRCGTCHPFHPFDIEQDCELNLLELPLIVMDATLQEYHNLSPEQGERRILDLAQRCRQVEGTFTLLWHNSVLQKEWRLWKKMYQRVVKVLADIG